MRSGRPSEKNVKKHGLVRQGCYKEGRTRPAKEGWERGTARELMRCMLDMVWLESHDEPHTFPTEANPTRSGRAVLVRGYSRDTGRGSR